MSKLSLLPAACTLSSETLKLCEWLPQLLSLTDILMGTASLHSGLSSGSKCHSPHQAEHNTVLFDVNFQERFLFLPNRRICISFSCRASYCPLILNCFSCTYQEPFLGSRGGGNCGIRSLQCALNTSECSHWQRQEGGRLKSRSWGTVLRDSNLTFWQ